MNKMFFLFGLICCLIFACSRIDNSPPAIDLQNKQLTMSEVKRIADQYGLGHLANEEKNGLLMYQNEDQVHEYFKYMRRAADKSLETDIYFQRTKDVHSFEDELNLLKSLPLTFEEKVRLEGGPEGFERWVAKRRSVQWRIYRDSTGVLTWVYPNDTTNISGERMDYAR